MTTYAPLPERVAQLAELPPLAHGKHNDDDFNKGRHCIAERTAWLAGEAPTDWPECASKTIVGFLQRWNDRLATDEERSRLLDRFALPLIGTVSTDLVERQRQAMLRAWACEFALPRLLDMADLGEHATAVRAKPDASTIRAARDAARKKRADAWDPFRKKIREAVAAELKKRKPAAAAVAAAAVAAVDAADAAAVDAAVADAAAVDAAVADAAAVDAVAAAAAAAADAAAAAAVAVDAVDAVAAVADAAEWWCYGTSAYWKFRSAVYDGVYKAVRAAYDASPARKAMREELEQGALDLVDAMIVLSATNEGS